MDPYHPASKIFLLGSSWWRGENGQWNHESVNCWHMWFKRSINSQTNTTDPTWSIRLWVARAVEWFKETRRYQIREGSRKNHIPWHHSDVGWQVWQMWPWLKIISNVCCPSLPCQPFHLVLISLLGLFSTSCCLALYCIQLFWLEVPNYLVRICQVGHWQLQVLGWG